MESKKYHSISEVSSMLNISQNILRNIEKKYPKLSVKQINKRRYYSNDNIKFLKKILHYNVTKEKNNTQMNFGIENFRTPKNIDSKLSKSSLDQPSKSHINNSKNQFSRDDKFKILKMIATLSYHKNILSQILNS